MAEPKRNIIALLAAQYHLEPEEFVRTIKRMCGLEKATAEEFLAFLLVAQEHDLNPLTREIFAFPKSGGGIQIILSIDGWLKKANSNPMFDGMEIKENFGAGQELVSISCRIWRKDRKIPIVATEYLKECRRNTDPWRNMPSRMLTHRAKVQAIRSAFGLAGVMEQDEAEAYLEKLKASPTIVVNATETPLDQIADSLPDASDDVGHSGQGPKLASNFDESEPVLEPEPAPPIEEPFINEEQQQMLQSAVVMAGWPVKAVLEVILVHAGCPLEQIKAGDFITVMTAIAEAGKRKKAKQQAARE